MPCGLLISVSAGAFGSGDSPRSLSGALHCIGLADAEVAVYNHSMPKTSAYPGLRVHRWTDKKGVVREAYYLDRRSVGQPDVPLGPDRDVALTKWQAAKDGLPVDPYSRARKNVPWNAPSKKAKAVRLKVRLPKLQSGQRRAFDAGVWDDVPEWAKRMYLNAERRAAERGGMLSLDDFKAVIHRASGHCELTGLPLDQEKKPGRWPMAPSIDRIDASRGYVAGNVRIVCLMANQALSEWGDSPVLLMAQALMRKHTSANGAI